LHAPKSYPLYKIIGRGAGFMSALKSTPLEFVDLRSRIGAGRFLSNLDPS
jgi:hypothetical protein